MSTNLFVGALLALAGIPLMLGALSLLADGQTHAALAIAAASAVLVWLGLLIAEE